MKKIKNQTNYFFIDEAGDPIFYDKNGNLIVGQEGCSKILLVGFIRTNNPDLIRKALVKLNEEIANDKYLKNIPSLQNSLQFLKENIFYDDLLAKLLENKLHTSTENKIYYAVRGNRLRQEPISSAIQTAILTFETKWKTKITAKIDVQAQTPSGEPCLQVIDYMNWAVQRAFVRGEMRYFDFIRDKVSYLVDIYDVKKYPKNFYNHKNPFSANKISPL